MINKHMLAALLAEKAKQNQAQGGAPALMRPPIHPSVGGISPMPSQAPKQNLGLPNSSLGAPQLAPPKQNPPMGGVEKALVPPVSSNPNFGQLKALISPKASSGNLPSMPKPQGSAKKPRLV